jgi:hypothetical protein
MSELGEVKGRQLEALRRKDRAALPLRMFVDTIDFPVPAALLEVGHATPCPYALSYCTGAPWPHPPVRRGPTSSLFE